MGRFVPESRCVRVGATEKSVWCLFGSNALFPQLATSTSQLPQANQLDQVVKGQAKTGRFALSSVHEKLHRAVHRSGGDGYAHDGWTEDRAQHKAAGGFLTNPEQPNNSIGPVLKQVRRT
jgi:hypothetical protein